MSCCDEKIGKSGGNVPLPCALSKLTKAWFALRVWGSQWAPVVEGTKSWQMTLTEPSRSK